MRHVFLAFMLFAAAGCASSRSAIRAEAGAFSVREYLETALETLAEADPDTNGHRIRAQVETRAALSELGRANTTRRVPYEGPPTLAVALELLERSTPQLQSFDGEAHRHAERAVQELRAALTPSP